MKIKKDGIEWGGPKGDWWCFYWWNWLPNHLSYWGIEHCWYDGPIGTFGFWYFNWSWQTPWSILHRDSDD